MGYIAGREVVNAAPAVFCAYMGVLAALSTTEAGAQVRQDTMPALRAHSAGVASENVNVNVNAVFLAALCRALVLMPSPPVFSDATR